MLVITGNTYPKNGLGRHEVGTMCAWVTTSNGVVELKRCDSDGKVLKPVFKKHEEDYIYDINAIISLGQIYARNGNLLSGKKEPPMVGIVAKFVKHGWYLEVEKLRDKDRLITICSNCLRASCWDGIFMCDENKTAETTQKTVKELKHLNLEHPSYWE